MLQMIKSMAQMISKVVNSDLNIISLELTPKTNFTVE